MQESKITYNPKEIIEYLERKDSLTPKDLLENWGYDRVVAGSVLSDLERLGAIVSEKMEVDGIKISITNYHLTEAGRKMKDSLQPRTIILTVFPIISKIVPEQFNYLMEVLGARGIRSDQLKEMLESDSPELRKLIDEAQLLILKDLSSEELRQLTREIVEMNKNVKP